MRKTNLIEEKLSKLKQIIFKLKNPYDILIIEEAKKERRKVNNMAKVIVEEHLDNLNKEDKY